MLCKHKSCVVLSLTAYYTIDPVMILLSLPILQIKQNIKNKTFFFLSFLFCSSLASSPSIEMENDSDSTYDLNRRSSSGALLSPEVNKSFLQILN